MTNPDWTFESVLTQPDGTQIRVTIAIPSRAAWKDVAETAEIAQMTASYALNQINRCKERPPF